MVKAMAVGRQTAGLKALKADGRSVWPESLAEELPWMGLRGARLALERRVEAFEGFEGGQTAGLNTFKSTWPWCLAAGV